jgi:hypothetical protein
MEVRAHLIRLLECGGGLGGSPSRAAREVPLLIGGQQSDVGRPGKEVGVVRQDVVPRPTAGRPVLRVQEVQGDVAADDPLPAKASESFH